MYDHWIERQEPAVPGTDTPVWAVFHDVFADVLLARALENAADRNDAIDRLFEQAAINGVLRQTLTSLERLGQSATIANVDWRARFLELERRHPTTLARHARSLLSNTLVTPETRLSLIALNNGLRESVAIDSSCDVCLALTAAALADGRSRDDEPGDLERVLLPLLDTAVTRAHSNLVARLAFQAQPARFRDAVRQSIAANSQLRQTHFLLKVWLDDAVTQDGKQNIDLVAEIEAHVTAWLASGDNVTSEQAGFVYSSWLDAAAAIRGDRAVEMVAPVEPYVTAWLASGNATRTEAQFVYKSWLDAAAAIKGDRAVEMVALVEAHVTAWLASADNAVRKDAQFVYSSWLDAAAAIKGDRTVEMVALVEAHVTAWMANWRQHKEGEQAEFSLPAGSGLPPRSRATVPSSWSPWSTPTLSRG